MAALLAAAGKERQADLGNFQCLVAEGAADGSEDEAEEGGVVAAAALSAPAAPAAGSAVAAAEAARRAAPKTATGTGAGDRVDLGPLVDFAVQLFFPPSMRLNYAATHEASSLRGVVVVDSWGEHVPRKRREMNNGTVRCGLLPGPPARLGLPAGRLRPAGKALCCAGRCLPAGCGLRDGSVLC